MNHNYSIYIIILSDSEQTNKLISFVNKTIKVGKLCETFRILT